MTESKVNGNIHGRASVRASWQCDDSLSDVSETDISIHHMSLHGRKSTCSTKRGCMRVDTQRQSTRVNSFELIQVFQELWGGIPLNLRLELWYALHLAWIP